MTAVLVGVAVWVLLSLPLAVLVGRAIRAGDDGLCDLPSVPEQERLS